jgi:hypothetical protein
VGRGHSCLTRGPAVRVGRGGGCGEGGAGGDCLGVGGGGLERFGGRGGGGGGVTMVFLFTS